MGDVATASQTHTNPQICILEESARLTVIHIFQDGDLGGGVVLSQTPPDRQRQGDIETLVALVQRVVDDHHATLLLPLALVEAQDAAVLLRAGDVVRVRQHGGGDRA